MKLTHVQLRRGAAPLAVAAVIASGTLAPAHAEQQGGESENEGPKNVIVMIGDGMGYNHVASTNLYETGQSQFITQGAPGSVEELDGEPVQRYEQDDFNLLGMSTYSADGRASYDSESAWGDFEWAEEGPTDSAAAGTAMASGTKTDNGMLNVDPEGDELTTISEIAHDTGRSAGVVTSVDFNHATPSAYAVANEDRDAFDEIGRDMIDAEHLDVIMGAGHPEFDDDGEPRDADYEKFAQEDYERLTEDETDWSYLEEKDDFEALAEDGEEAPEKVFGLTQTATTLQQERSGDSEDTLPGEVEFNDNVPDLPTMSQGALNSLGQNDEGFHLMIEGGAIDWTGHDNQTTRNIEETQDFNASVETVVDWVEENSSWEETLLVVTADHETGYLGGATDNPKFSSMHGQAEELPNVGWSSDEHTNHLVPYFFKGAGSEELIEATKEEGNKDAVRGPYLDNTTLTNLLKDDLWETP